MTRRVRCYRTDCCHFKRRLFGICENRHFILGMGRRSPLAHPYKRATLARNWKRQRAR